jgi:hypothetical protein
MDNGQREMHVDREALFGICARHHLPATIPAVVPEPYIPYIPEDWNGILVLAEAQNLSDTNRAYREKLLAADTRLRYGRLGPIYGIGIEPWADGTMPFAVEAAFGVDPKQCAISNAIPWSQAVGRTNVTPATAMIRAAAPFLLEVLRELRPNTVLVCGKRSQWVFDEMRLCEAPPWRLIRANSASPLGTAQLIREFPLQQVEQRFPSVATLMKKYSSSRYWKNRVAFACHVVQLVHGGVR